MDSSAVSSRSESHFPKKDSDMISQGDITAHMSSSNDSPVMQISSDHPLSPSTPHVDEAKPFVPEKTFSRSTTSTQKPPSPQIQRTSVELHVPLSNLTVPSTSPLLRDDTDQEEFLEIPHEDSSHNQHVITIPRLGAPPTTSSVAQNEYHKNLHAIEREEHATFPPRSLVSEDERTSTSTEHRHPLNLSPLDVSHNEFQSSEIINLSQQRPKSYPQHHQIISPASVSSALVLSPTDENEVVQEKPFEPVCHCIYGKLPTSAYRQRYDKIGQCSEILKIIVIGFILQWFWLRAIGIVISFFCGFAGVLLVALFTGKKYEQLTGNSRLIFNKIMKVSSRCAMFFFGIWRLHGHRVSKQDFDRIRERYSSIPRKEEEKLDYAPFYVISNHISIVDPLIHLCAFGPLSIVCKQSLRKIPFFGRALELIQCIFVSTDNRSNVEKMRKREQTYLSRASRREHSRFERKLPPQLLIFPEGTTSSGKQIIRFHGGAFKSGQAVQPIFIDYPYKRFNMSWTKVGFSYGFYILSQVYNSCSYYILPPYVPNEEEKKNWKLYAYNVQRVLVDVGNMYRPTDNQLFASCELFFRYPKKPSTMSPSMDEDADEREIPDRPHQEESSFHSVLRMARETESLQTPINDEDEIHFRGYQQDL